MVSGATASALSAALGKLGSGSAFAPTNAVSHYVFGEKAAHRDLPSIRYTIHHLSASAVACFADYQLTPERLQPGHEKRLSTPSLAVMHGAFGLGLAFGALTIRRR